MNTTTEALTRVRNALIAAVAAVDAALGQDALPIHHSDLLTIEETAEIAGVTDAMIGNWAAGHSGDRAQDWFAYLLGGK